MVLFQACKSEPKNTNVTPKPADKEQTGKTPSKPGGNTPTTPGGKEPKPSTPPETPPAELSLSRYEIKDVLPAGETHKIEVETNKGWTATSSMEWVQLSPTKGSGKSVLQLVIASNPETKERKATVTVATEGLTKQINITQLAAEQKESLLLSEEVVKDVPVAGKTIEVTVNSSAAWQATTSADDVKVQPKTGKGKTPVTIVIPANPNANEREITVTFVMGKLSKTVTVSQEGCAQLELSQSQISEVPHGGKSYDITVTSSGTWTAKSSATWVTLTPSNGKGNGTLRLQVQSNSTSQPRTATVTVTSGAVSKTVTVTQEGRTQLELSQSQISEVPHGGKSYDITVTSNSTWTAKSSASWITVSPANGKGNGTLRLQVQSNSTTQSRTATVTVTSGAVSKTVTVTQQAASQLELSQRGVSDVPSSGKSYDVTVTSNVSWSAKSNASWVTVNPSSGKGNSSIRLQVQANTTSQQRSATVTVEGGGVRKTITVTQQAEVASAQQVLQVTPSSLQDQPSGQTRVSITVKATQGWTAAASAPWIRISPRSGEGDGTIRVTIVNNGTGAPRNGTITVTSGKFQKVIAVSQQSAQSQLRLSPQNISNAPGAGGRYEITVSTSTSWTASTTDSWIQLTPNSGSRSGVMSVVLQPNSSTSPRTGRIVVRSGAQQEILTVTQLATVPERLDITPSELKTIPYIGHTYDVRIITTAAWQVSNLPTWATVSQRSGTGETTIRLTVEPNTATSVRNGQVEVQSGTLRKTVTLSQNAVPSRVPLSVDEKEFNNIPYSGEVYNVAITTDTEWRVEAKPSWITVNPESGRGKSYVYVFADRNEQRQDRSGTIKISTATESVTINVHQKERPMQEKDLRNHTYRLPVIFHVVHWEKGKSSSDYAVGQRLKQLIDKTNRLFRGEISNTIQKDYTVPAPTNANVVFELATQDPNGRTLTTPGLNRLKVSEAQLTPEKVMDDRKGGVYHNAAWDRTKYINVYIINMGSDKQTGSDGVVMGIAHLPYAPNGYDIPGLFTINPSRQNSYNHCIVINAQKITSDSPNFESKGMYPPNRGKYDAATTLAHELGHYLGLFHVFSENTSASTTYSTATCRDTDHCDDTPSYNREEYVKTTTVVPTGVNWDTSYANLFFRISCDGKRFPSTNIMDYDFGDRFHFTPQQISRMRKVLIYSPSVPGPKAEVPENGISVLSTGPSYPRKSVCQHYTCPHTKH